MPQGTALDRHGAWPPAASRPSAAPKGAQTPAPKDQAGQQSRRQGLWAESPRQSRPPTLRPTHASNETLIGQRTGEGSPTLTAMDALRRSTQGVHQREQVMGARGTAKLRLATE